MTNHEEIFSLIYKSKKWGDNESKSGFASARAFNEPFYIPFLKKFILDNKIKKILDFGCGDFNFGEAIYNDIDDIDYTGYDCCKDLIEENIKKFPKYKFVYIDLIQDLNKIETCDLAVAKDLFQHWSNFEIELFLKTLIKEKKIKYIIMTYTWNIENIKFKDIKTGEFKPLSISDFPLNQFNPTLIKRWGDLSKYYELNGDWFPYIMETSLIERI